MKNEHIEIVNEYKRFDYFLTTLAQELKEFMEGYIGKLLVSICPPAGEFLHRMLGKLEGAVRMLEGYNEYKG